MSTANSVVDGFSVPDGVLPSQHFSGRTKHLEPEKQLMLAVLTDAVRCFRMGSACGQGPRRRLFADAEWWLFRAEGNGPFSVQSICDALEIDTRRLRRGILRLARPRARGRSVADDSPLSRASGQASKRERLDVSSRRIKRRQEAQECRNRERPGLTLLVLQLLVELAQLCELLIGRDRGMRVLLRRQLLLVLERKLAVDLAQRFSRQPPYRRTLIFIRPF